MRPLLVVLLLVLGTTTALADPVPIDPLKSASPWTFPIALLVLVAIVAFAIRRRR